MRQHTFLAQIWIHKMFVLNVNAFFLSSIETFTIIRSDIYLNFRNFVCIIIIICKRLKIILIQSTRAQFHPCSVKYSIYQTFLAIIFGLTKGMIHLYWSLIILLLNGTLKKLQNIPDFFKLSKLGKINLPLESI